MRFLFHLPRCIGGVLLAVFTLSTLEAQTNTPVRIMAANLNGNTQSYQPFAIRIFQGLKPDIVAIQEFNYSNNTPADFRSLVDGAFGADFSYFRESGYSLPNGIISRYPIVASGSWADTVQSSPNRGFAWAQIDLPGTNDLYLVSVHLLSSSSTSRASEAANLKSLVESNFPSNAWIVVAGDLNTDTRTETAVTTLITFLSDNPIPTDAEAGGDADTNEPRNKPYDYVLPSFSLTNLMISSVFPSHSFSNGLVFDSRVYVPLSDIDPVLVNDSSNAQHMAVIKDFLISGGVTNSTNAPLITTQPQSQTVPQGSNATFTVAASGAAPLSFQWRFNGVDISGAQASSYTRTNVQPADAGDYSVVVSNTAGSATSSNATLTVASAPVITMQPQSQTVFAGQNVTFTVVANGAAPLNYQWRFNGIEIAGATTNSYARPNAQTNDAGNYSVVVTNAFGTATSADAALMVIVQQGSVIAQWDFNSLLPDTNTTTGTTTPSVGSGSAVLVGGVSQTFSSGSSTDPASSGADNSAWSTANYPAQGTGNKTAGVRFNVSTVGRQNISIRWDQRESGSASKYVRLQYTTNGNDFLDFPTATSVAGTTFESKTNTLAGFPAVNDNPSFAFRIVSEFESTAAGTANQNYVGASSSYGTAGTIRFDIVTVSGTIIPTNAAPAPAVLTGPVYTTNFQFQFTVTGSAGSNYVVQASTNLSASNWISLRTNVSPFLFVETNANSFVKRFYRAFSLQ